MKIAVLGTVGIPARYGGFETLAENLARHAPKQACGHTLTVYCSRPAYPDARSTYLGARLRYSRLKANGAQSIFYDILTLLDAVIRGHDALLLLGVSGAIALPFIRLASRARIVTNVDGIEWRREKWRGLPRWLLRLSEWVAVRSSHAVVADNQGIAEYLGSQYGIEAQVIAYGGDHAVALQTDAPPETARLPRNTPARYALGLCRIEPENNVHMILEAFAQLPMPLVFVGNWRNNSYGRTLLARYGKHEGIELLDPIYDPNLLFSLRAGALVYVHGHSAGGSNPSLIEMMHFGLPIYAYDCIFNRHTTEDRALYFSSSNALSELVRKTDVDDASSIGASMLEIAHRRYRWDKIISQYFQLLGGKGGKRIQSRPDP